jgi:hypothetical protein
MRRQFNVRSAVGVVNEVSVTLVITDIGSVFWRGCWGACRQLATLEVVDIGMVETWGNTPGTGTEGNDGDPREKGND